MATRVERMKHTTVRDDDLYDSNAPAARAQFTLANFVWWLAGIIIALLAVRFLLSMLGANTTNSFANFIYSVSHPFVAPFFGLFNYDNIQYGVSRFEVYTLVAMVVYAIVAWAIAALITINRRPAA